MQSKARERQGRKCNERQGKGREWKENEKVKGKALKIKERKGNARTMKGNGKDRQGKGMQ